MQTSKKKYLDDVSLLYFSNPYDALRVLQDKFTENEAVNLIITDIDFNEMDGYEFAINVRELEIENNNFPVPVIAISSRENNDELLNIGLEEKLFNYHFKKDKNVQIDSKKICDIIKAAFWSNIFR